MYIEYQTNSGNQLIPLETRMLTQRRIILKGEITMDMATAFYEQLTHLSTEDPDEPIHLYINSPGGSVDAGLTILDMVQTCQTPIRMYCVGNVYSMAAVIFASGRNGRYMMNHSKLMLHQPLVGRNMGGNATDIKSLSDSLLETRSELNSILATSTGKTLEEIEENTTYDHYFTAQEAIQFGLADEIAGFETYKEGK